MPRLTRPFDSQTKLILLLVAVIVPTFALVTAVQYKVTQPVLEAEMRQIGITTAESIANKILGNKLFQSPGLGAQRIESEIQEELYYQPNILRIHVYFKDPLSGKLKLVAATVEEDASHVPPEMPDVDKTALFHDEEGQLPYWDIRVPIRSEIGLSKTPKKPVGLVSLSITTRTLKRLSNTFWRLTFAGALLTLFFLIISLNFFLRKLFASERRLRVTESENIKLWEQLHESQRELMNLEKLAVMGQLTANLAHEIGTPLNAISGHIQLLREETGSKASRSGDRLQIISGELKRIELTVKDFLQTTAKPESQKQLVDINPTVERTLQIVFPRTQALGIDVEFVPDRRLGPLRTVPTDLQQILLNLVNNAMDSLSEKLNRRPKHRPKLRLTSRLVRDEGMDWAEITVHDNGLGIKRTDISNVMKPFFSTKTPGKGTGLGLAICQQLAARNGGAIQLDSREGTWTDAKVRFPYAKAS